MIAARDRKRERGSHQLEDSAAWNRVGTLALGETRPQTLSLSQSHLQESARCPWAPAFSTRSTEAFDRAAGFTHHQPTLLANIKACKNLFYTSFPIKRDDGTIEVIHAWRAEHSHHKLPSKGGIRYASRSTRTRCRRSRR